MMQMMMARHAGRHMARVIGVAAMPVMIGQMFGPSLGGEDFALMAERVPAFQLRVGSSQPGRSDKLHNSAYQPDERCIGDVAGSVRYLRSLPYANGKVGVIGYCSGGRQTYIVACNLPVDAAVRMFLKSYGRSQGEATPAAARHHDFGA